MINENNKIVKQMFLGHNKDFSETYFKSLTENGETWYSGSRTMKNGMEWLLPYTKDKPEVAWPNPNAKWVDTRRAID